MKILLSSLAIFDRQRKRMDGSKVQELADSFRENGQLQNIVVRSPLDEELAFPEVQGKPYVLVAGGRRTMAAMLLGWTEIEAILKEDILDPYLAKMIELEENARRENLDPFDEAEARTELAELHRVYRPNASQRELAELVGVSQAQLSKDIALTAAVKKDPGLRLAGTKGSAIRKVAFKQEIQARVAKVESNKPHADNIRSKLFTADGSSFIRTIPTGSIDMVFSDLPYGKDHYETISSSGVVPGHYDDSREATKDFVADIVPQCLRVVKPTGWVVFFMCYEWHGWLQELIHDTCSTHHDYRCQTVGGEPTRTCKICVAKQFDERPCDFFSPELPPWIWTRRGSGNHGHWPELHASNRYELIVVVNAGQAKLLKKPVENVLDFPPFSGDRLHAMQKPHELCREIIERCTVPGERVLDICFGSGAHLAAAASLGRDFLGCDSDPDNLASALTLVSKHYTPRFAPTAVADSKSDPDTDLKAKLSLL